MAGGLVELVTLPIDPGVDPAAVLEFAAHSAGGLADRHGPARRLGLAFPGLLGGNGAVLSAPNLAPGWVGIVPSAELCERIGLEVAVANDARVATLGEFAFGSALSDQERPTSTMVYIGLGTGVGGGVVINGRVHGGGLGSAGELGHVVIEPEGPACACGSRGCVEVFAGGASLVAAASRILAEGQARCLRELLSPGSNGERATINVELIAKAAEAGDRELERLLDRAGQALGVLATNLIQIVAPNVIVLGGGLSLLGERLVESLWQELRERVQLVPLDGLRIERSSLGDQAGLLGGLALAGIDQDQDFAVHRSIPATLESGLRTTAMSRSPVCP